MSIENCDKCANNKCANVGQPMTVRCDKYVSIYDRRNRMIRPNNRKVIKK